MRKFVAMAIVAIALPLSTRAYADYQLKMTLPEGTAVWAHKGATQEGLYEVGANLDLDGDGRRDLVAERWFWNETPPTYRMEVYGTPGPTLLWASARFSSLVPTPTFYGFYDIDGNGNKEVLFRLDQGSYQYLTVAIDWTDPDNAVIWSNPAEIKSIWDVDGDGIEDIFISNTTTGRGEVWGYDPLATMVPGSASQNEANLEQIRCTPDPSNGSTRITYRLGAPGTVDIRMFNARGQSVRHLVAEIQNSGDHDVTWDCTDDNGRTVPSGIYLCRIARDRDSLVTKVTIVK